MNHTKEAPTVDAVQALEDLLDAVDDGEGSIMAPRAADVAKARAALADWKALNTVKTTEELHVGDTIRVWWRPGRDTITGLRDYDGVIPELRGGRIADFALNQTGMTLPPGDRFELVAREADRG